MLVSMLVRGVAELLHPQRIMHKRKHVPSQLTGQLQRNFAESAVTGSWDSRRAVIGGRGRRWRWRSGRMHDRA